MKIALITGSAGLIGSQAVEFLAEQGFTVIGIDNDMRAYFFGKEASTLENGQRKQTCYSGKQINPKQTKDNVVNPQINKHSRQTEQNQTKQNQTEPKQKMH